MYTRKQQEDRQYEMFDSYLTERVIKIEEEYMATEKYQKQSEQEKKLNDQLESRLKGELKVLFEEYTNILYGIISDQQEYFFRRGLMEFNKTQQFLSGVQCCL